MKLLTALVVGLNALSAWGQSCSSDGQPRPTQWSERFFNADCESCWSQVDNGSRKPGELVLEWIVPSAKGDEAPLSAAASRDGLARLQMLGASAVAATAASDLATSAESQSASAPRFSTIVQRQNGVRLRVAHGLRVVNYVGASIELRVKQAKGPWTAVLLLVEDIPAGTAGTPIERHLVRNMQVTEWNTPPTGKTATQRRWFDSRPMSLPEGTQFERLRVMGWVQDSSGRVVVAGMGKCGIVR